MGWKTFQQGFMRRGGIGAMLLGLLLSGPAHAVDVQETLAYKLAVLHANAESPGQFLIQGQVEPPQAVISEFQWIMDSLRQVCLNPETALADTIVEIWQALKRTSSERSLLEAARDLSRTAVQMSRARQEKVNFRMTSRYWLKQQLDRAPGR